MYLGTYTAEIIFHAHIQNIITVKHEYKNNET